MEVQVSPIRSLRRKQTDPNSDSFIPGGWREGAVQTPASSPCGDSGPFPRACGLLEVELQWRRDPCQRMLRATILLSPSPPLALFSVRHHPILEEL